MKKQPIRISMKELAKQATSKTVIPEDYVKLEKAEVEKTTEKALLIKFVYAATTYSFWIAKQHIIEDKSNYYCAGWIIDLQIKNK